MKKPILLLLLIIILVSCEKNGLIEKPETDFGTVILEDYFVTSMAFEAEGAAWIGTFKQGLVKYEQKKITVFVEKVQ